MCQTAKNLYKIIRVAQQQHDAKKEQVFKSLLKKHQGECPECNKG